MAQFEPWKFWNVSRKVLAKGFLQRLYTRSVRLIELWAADPACCENTARDPLTRLRIHFQRLDLEGFSDYAIEAGNFMYAPMGFHLVPINTAKSDKGNVDGEVADAAEKLGELRAKIVAANKDGKIDVRELTDIKGTAARLISEVEQILDAAGVAP